MRPRGYASSGRQVSELSPPPLGPGVGVATMEAPQLPFDDLPPRVTKQSTLRPKQAEVVIALRHRGVSSTAEQILDTLHAAGFLRRTKNEVASRLAELADTDRFPEALVRKVGKVRASTGKSVAAWDLTLAGRLEAKALEQ